MKKTLIIELCMVLFLCNCHKTEKMKTSIYDATAVLLDKKDANNITYLVTVMLGHPASECKGCVYINGRLYHYDCMGDGNACAASSIVSLVQISGNNYTATTLDSTALTNEDFFNMPSRSLFVEYDEKNNEVWLNIPAQLVFRDSTTQQFTFTNLFYSNSAYYTNN